MEKIIRAMSWQRHVLYAYAACMAIVALLGTAEILIWEPKSESAIAAAFSGMRQVLPWLFGLCAIALLPFVTAHARCISPPRWVNVLLCMSSFTSALLWVGVTFAARHANLVEARAMYLMYAASAIALMLIVSADMNSKLRDEWVKGFIHKACRDSNRVTLQEEGTGQ